MRGGAAALLLLLAGCATELQQLPESGPRMPREIREGRADSVVQAVESDVSREEVVAAINAMLTRTPICMRMPGLWLDGEVRLGVFVVRYDLMERDWGGDVAAGARRRMDEFVEMGFLTAQDGAATTYTFTETGRDLLSGSFESRDPPSFCGPAQRRVAEITNMEWGSFNCGSLRVRFTHVADSWPSWATSETARTRAVEAMSPPGETAAGSVSLTRLWFSRENREQSANNGALRSLCYDAARQVYAGGDLNLRATPP